jgi:hypothetical protein
MPNVSVNRRQFIQPTTLAGMATSIHNSLLAAVSLDNCATSPP